MGRDNQDMIRLEALHKERGWGEDASFTLL